MTQRKIGTGVWGRKAHLNFNCQQTKLPEANPGQHIYASENFKLHIL